MPKSLKTKGAPLVFLRVAICLTILWNLTKKGTLISQIRSFTGSPLLDMAEQSDPLLEALLLKVGIY